MRLARRVAALVIAVVLVAAFAGVGLVALITGRALPQTNGTLHVAGLHADVSVMRDAAGIAQIYADDSHDLFLAQGYVHAQDRLWQMEVWRRIGEGRLAELFGPAELDEDRLIRTLGWRQAAARDLAALPTDLRDDLQAYADGVNAYIDAHRGALGPPFVVTGMRTGNGGLGGFTPEPWTPLDTVTWEKVEAFSLGGNLDSELFHLAADGRLGDPARTDELFPPYPADAPVIAPGGAPSELASAPASGSSSAARTVPDSASAAPSASASASASATSAASMPGPTPTSAPLRESIAEGLAWSAIGNLRSQTLALAGLDSASGLVGDHGVGSNDWVVGPSKSATGHALLANDPHLGIGMPSVWYLNGLHCRTVSDACPWEVVGATFPGVPFVVLGHNARIAWGATNAGPDVEDLVQEKVDPNDPSHYLVGARSLLFQTRRETIHVAGAADVAMTVRQTIHGPILNDVENALKTSSTLYALRWSAVTVTDTTLRAFYELNRARDWTSFRAALSWYVAPAQNFVYADVDGHIGYQMPGWIPIRQDPNDDGERPVPGWDGGHEWTGSIPYDELPRLYDPPAGIIATSNNAVVDAGYSHFIARDWDPGFRAQRVLDVLGAAATAGGVTLDAMSALQNDTLVGRAPLIVSHLGDAITKSANGAAVLAAIRSWDRRCGVESLGCSAYMAFEYRLLRGTFDDELGPLAREYVGSTESWLAIIALLARPNDAWWDDTTTPVRETATDIIDRALDAAGADLRSALGPPARWAWGRLHTATFREATLGSSGIGPLAWYFDVGPEAIPGAAGAVDNTYYQFSRAYPDPYDASFVPAHDLRGVFEVTNLPSLRFDIDMGAIDGARIIQTTGQSGNPFDRHYGDFIDAWIAGRQVPLPFTAGAVADAAAERLELVR